MNIKPTHSPRRRARHFNRAFLLLSAGPYAMVAATALALNLEPLAGGLTRVGGFAEHQYGWQGKQEALAEPGHEARSKPVYDRYADMVVIGDSFSYLPSRAPWQGYLRRLTGWSIVTYNFTPGTLEALLASPEFERHPPRVLVLESVERELAHRFGRPGPVVTWKPDPRWNPLPLHPVAIEGREVGRLDGQPPIRVDMSQTAHWLSKQFQRQVLAQDDPQVKVIPLARHDLFSHRASHEMLVWHEDLAKRQWSPQTRLAIRESVLALRQRVQSNGRTAFVLMVAPDKTTVYAEHAVDTTLQHLSPLGWLGQDPRLPMPRLDLALRKETRRVRDIYLPNGTHWGSRGHEVVAETLLAHLQARGLADGGQR